MAATSSKPHLLIIPFPHSGHIIPLLDLSHHLSLNNLIVTVLLLPETGLISLINPYNSANLQSLILPIITPRVSPSQLPQSPILPFYQISISMKNSLSGPISDWFHAHPSPPIAIISDFFLGWTNSLAESLGIPRIVFYPSGAFTVSIFRYLWPNMPQPRKLDRSEDDDDDDDDDFPIEMSDVPNSPVFPWCQLPRNYRMFRESDPTSESYREDFLANFASWGSVFNSFRDLERVYLDHLSERRLGRLPYKKKSNGDGDEERKMKVWAVGPLLPPEDIYGERGGESSVPIEEIIKWLDSKPRSSVIYVCFGSRAMPSEHDIAVLAEGFEFSGANFLWCFQKGAVMPENLNKSRTLLVDGWAPQVVILNHVSVCGFLTHCGWNSVMEGITAGVPLLTWPMKADQFLTERLIVDELKLATRVRKLSGSPEPEDVAEAVKKVIDGGDKVKAAEWRRRAVEAISDGGSSLNDLTMLVKELHELNSQ